MRKRIMALILALLVLSLAGCSSQQDRNSLGQAKPQENSPELTEQANEVEKVIVRVGTLKGPTGMGMAGLMRDNDAGETVNDYQFVMKSSPEDIRTQLINGDVDIAALPTNVASVLYNKADGSVKILAVNTLGVLYVLESGETVTTVQDLRGKDLYATGQGSVPEYVLRYILEQNGIDSQQDLNLSFKSEHDELATRMVAGEAQLGMLPEPFVTSTMNQDESIRVALDLTNEWEQVSNGAPLSMGCIVVRTEFLEENKGAVDFFLQEYEASVVYVNNNIDEAAEVMEEYDIIKAAVAKKAIPNCNIVYIDGAEMKNSVQQFLEVIHEADPQSVGGNMPDDAFYYQMMHFIIKSNHIKKIGISLLVAVFWLLVWQCVYLYVKKEILVVSPFHTARRLWALSHNIAFWQSIGATCLRVLKGFFGAFVAGGILAVLTARYRLVYMILRPLLGIVKSTPVASFVILALLWISEGRLPVFIAFLMVVPLVWANLHTGILSTDSELLEMAGLFQLPWWKTVKFIYIPAAMPYFVAAWSAGFGFAWKSAIAAEVISKPPDAIGTRIHESRIYLETADLFAWTVCVILLSILLEWAMLFILQRLTRQFAAMPPSERRISS